MKIKIENLGMAYSDSTVEQAASRTAQQWGVIVELTGETCVGNGWPEINVIGTPLQIQKMMTEDSGWSTGDDAEDAEMLFYYFKDAKPVFG